MILHQMGIKITDWAMGFFGLSTMMLTAKMYIIDQLPNLPEVSNGTPLVILLGTYLSLVLTALWKQSASIKNIDENIEKQQRHNQGILDVLEKTLKKDDERHEAIAKILKNIEEKEDKQIDLMSDPQTKIPTGSHKPIKRIR